METNPLTERQAKATAKMHRQAAARGPRDVRHRKISDRYGAVARQIAAGGMTADESAGMEWWNALSEDQRAYWLREANTAIVAEAWAYYKHVLSQLPD
jgi:hypothetical protein